MRNFEMDPDAPLPSILHLLLGAQGGGCERNCLLFCEWSRHLRHAVLTLGPAGEMTAPWQQAATEVRHLDILDLSRPAQARRVRAALGELAVLPGAVMLWHGMPEMPFLLHALRDWRGPVFAHAGNPHLQPSRWLDLRFLVAERLWPSPHRPTFVCCSEHVAGSLENGWYLRRFPRTTVPNGVRPVQGEGHRPRVLAPHAPLTMGMLARLDPIKDHATVLRAMARARVQLPGLRLEFAGDGPEKQRLRALADELGLGDSVRFLGNVGAVYDTLAGWDVFVYAATVQEGFGNALAEALTCGLPAVVTDVGPMREVCGGDEEGAAVCVPPADPEAMAAAIVALVSDLPRRRALSEAARRRAERELSAQTYADRYERIFHPWTPGECPLTMPGMRAADRPSTRPCWIVCQLGAREHYAIPRALHLTGELALLLTDIWCGPALARSWLGRRLPRADSRYEPELAAVPTVAFSRTFILLAALRRLIAASAIWRSWLTRVSDSLFQRLAARRLARMRPPAVDTRVFAYSYSARDIFRAAKKRGWTTVLGQINPGPREEEIVDEVCRREAGVPGTMTAPSYWQRWREECELADAIVVNSEWSRRLLVEGGIEAARLHIIPLAYEPPGEAAAFRRDYPARFTRERPLRVLYLGALHLRKGIHLLLQAAGRLAEQDAPVEFTLVGRDEVPGGLPSRLLGNVRWVAEVSRKETATFYQEADVFALPTFSDGFALTLLEAQAWKLPAIVSRRCGQVIEDGVNGWVLDALDESPIRQILLDCLQSPELLRDRADRAIGFERFSLAAINRQMEALHPVAP